MRELATGGATYELIQTLGQGLSSTVYRAIRKDNLGHSRQTVALKILNSETTVSWLRQQFAALVRVNSPFCVKVLAWDNLDSGSALAMEWIDGVSLLELARRQRLSRIVINEIVGQVQEGLRALAEERLHHGDLSPGNILIDRLGQVKLIDFGAPPRSEQFVHGTPACMSPEVWEGEPTTIEGDLFSLGMIEQDLICGFHLIPSDPREARARAIRVATDGRGWLSARPTERKFVSRSSQSEAQEHLAFAVDRCLLDCSLTLQTLVTPQFEAGNRAEFYRFSRLAIRFPAQLVMILVLLLVLTLPVRAGAPALQIQSHSGRSARLEIRTQHWMQISVDGVKHGFTPLVLSSVSPGEHLISWKTAQSAGKELIKLGAGDHKRLQEKDLMHFHHPQHL